jgi:hypothetical protein
VTVSKNGEPSMPIVTPTGVVIRHVVLCVAATTAVPVHALDRLFDDDVRPEPRLLARPGSDPAALSAVQPGQPLRCAGGPRRLIDLDLMRGHAGRMAHSRYRRWRNRPDAVDVRAWERALMQQGRDAYVEHRRLRATAGDAFLVLDGEGRRICPADISLAARHSYAIDVNRHLDALAGDALVLTATV